MDSSHRATVLVTSCLKTPVDPLTKVPLALYERARAAPGITDEEQSECDSELDPGTVDAHATDSSPLPKRDRCKMCDQIDLRKLYLSNEEYYGKLEQLRSAHLYTMADLDLMYLKKLELKGTEPMTNHDCAWLLQYHQANSTTGRKLKKVHSAHELRSNIYMDEVRDGHGVNQNITKVLSSPQEHIKNMWQGFHVDKIPPRKQPHSSASLENHSGDREATMDPNIIARVQRSKKGEGWRPQVTVPKPFQMTLREAEHKRKGIRSRAEIERENEKLLQELEELTECQRKFRASAVPAHVYLPLYEELRERDEERRRRFQAAEHQRLLSTQRPFSFVEREQIKKEQKELTTHLSNKEQEEQRIRACGAKLLPRAVKDAAFDERQQEERLCRNIKKEMRATEMLLSASEPPSTLSKRLGERRAQRQQQSADIRDRISSQVPDFDTRYTRFRKQLANKREFRPLTACEPFELCTSKINPRKERRTAIIEVDKRSQIALRCRNVPLSPQTPTSSMCSSLSGSRDYLPSKMTTAAKKRQEAVRKVLEQRKKSEEDKEKWNECQRQNKRKLQMLVAKRARANDPHVALEQIRESKLKAFRKQDMQRRMEYQEEMRGIQERVKNIPLLLERVTQMNAKKAAERCYTNVLHAFGLTEVFVNSKGPTHRMNQTSDHLEDADFKDYLTGDYPPDYEDYEQEVEDVLTDRKQERPKEDKGDKLDKEGDLNLDGDSSRSHEEDVAFDDNIHQNVDYSDKGCGDGGDRHHSNISRASDDSKRSTSSLLNGGRKAEGESGQGGQECMSDECI